MPIVHSLLRSSSTHGAYANTPCLQRNVAEEADIFIINDGKNYCKQGKLPRRVVVRDEDINIACLMFNEVDYTIKPCAYVLTSFMISAILH